MTREAPRRCYVMKSTLTPRRVSHRGMGDGVNILDLSAFHYDDHARPPQQRFFERIPFHREDPDGFNNDIFGWSEGGNGTSYVHFFPPAEMGPPFSSSSHSPLGGGDGDNDNGGGATVTTLPPPPITIANRLFASPTDLARSFIATCDEKDVSAKEDQNNNSNCTDTATSQRQDAHIEQQTSLFVTIEALEMSLARAVASVSDSASAAAADALLLVTESGRTIAQHHAPSSSSSLPERLTEHSSPSQHDLEIAIDTRTSSSPPPLAPSGGRQRDTCDRMHCTAQTTGVVLIATAQRCENSKNGAPFSPHHSHRHNIPPLPRGDTDTCHRVLALLRQCQQLAKNEHSFLSVKVALSAADTSISKGAGASSSREEKEAHVNTPRGGNTVHACIPIAGIVLGAIPPTSSWAPNKWASVAYCTGQKKKQSLIIAPLKIVSSFPPSVFDGSNAHRRHPFSVTPARVVVIDGAEIDADTAIDVSHSVTHDSPFFPGGQSLLTCPAAASLRARDARAEGSSPPNTAVASKATTECRPDEPSNATPQSLTQVPLSAAASQVSPPPLSHLTCLVGCDVGTHVDSPQHFYSDANHKSILDLKGGGFVAKSCCSYRYESAAHNDSNECADTSNVPSCGVCSAATSAAAEASDLVVPLVIVDVREACRNNADYLITVEDVKKACGKRSHAFALPSANEPCAENTPCLENALVVGLTGWSHKFVEATETRRPEVYKGKANNLKDSEMHFPGFSEECARFLIELPHRELAVNNGVRASVAGIGIDTLSLDCGMSEDFIVHQIMLGMGNKYQVENLNLTAVDDRVLGYLNKATCMWHAVVLPIAVHGAYEANGRAIFLQFR